MRRHGKALLAALTLLIATGVATATADTAPTPTIAPPANVQYSTAHLAGEVNPNGGPSIAHWRFEWSTDHSSWTQGQDHELSQAQSEESTPIPVEEDISGLSASTTYFVRLAASNQGGENQSGEEELTTKGPVTPPSVTIDAPSLISAQNGGFAFTGHVNPNGTDPAFETHWHFDCEPSCGNPPGGTIAPDESSHLVEAEVEGLEPKTTYTVTLHASNAGGEETAQATFKTPAGPPIVATAPTISRSDGSAPLDSLSLSGFVNPRKATITDCHFAYGTDENYGHDLPCEPSSPTGNEPVEVHAALSGLAPGATYHFQLEATSVGGSAHTEDGVFRAPEASASESCPNEAIRLEQHATFLPDCRAYEQVSPLDKNGADVVAYTGLSRGTASGQAISYASLTAFGDARGTGVTSEYVARRGGTGWTTHSIIPATDSGTLPILLSGAVTFYNGNLSSDLTHGVLFAARPVTDSPAVAATANLYLRNDLLSPGAGHYQLLTACLLCEAEATKLPGYTSSPGIDGLTIPGLTDASPDLEHVAFESLANLTAEAPPQSASCGYEHAFFPPPGAFFCMPRLYEWDHGTLHLAGILPNGEPADASWGGVVGTSIRDRAPHLVSDGSDGHQRVIFTQPTDAAGQTPSEVEPFEAAVMTYFNEFPQGNLFARVDGAYTVKLNESERTEGEPSPYAPAVYLDASSNGERVFFMTTQALTNDASLNGGSKIYMYDASKPGTDPHNLTLISVDREPAEADDARGIIGISSDGHYVYFIANGQLVPGGPRSQADIYLWHDGKIRFVAQVSGLDENLLGGRSYRSYEHQARVSPDGQHLVFSSLGSGAVGVGPTGYNQEGCFTSLGSGCREIYTYNAETDLLQCASCNPSGAPANVPGDPFESNSQNSFMTSDYAETNSGEYPKTSYFGRALSSDGRFVFFDSIESLVPRDTNGKIDAYEYDTVTGETHLLSSGTSSDNSYFVEASDGGHDAFIVTRERLSAADTDESNDLYDVHIGGGFPEPPPKPAQCEGETCQGAQSAAPGPPAVGSGLQGRGNRKPRRKHHHRKHRGHHHRGHHRRSNNREAAK